MKNTIKNKIGYIVVASVLLGSFVVLNGTAFAAGPGFGHRGQEGRAPGVVGTVSAINSNIITVTSKAKPNGGTAVTYTVDANGATIMKGGSNSSISNIAVGDTIMVQGTVNGTSVTATSIRDGAQPAQRFNQNASQNPIIQGNGQPVVGGNVTAMNGTTLTITNKSNVAYTVDATNAKITKAGAESSLSNIVVGDDVIVQGTVNGTSVIASSIIDQGVPRALPINASSRAVSATNSNPGFFSKVFGTVGGFFHNVFGFF
jgi:hypothetical protein